MLIAANYTFNSAPRDGTVIGHWSGPLILQHMMGNPAVHIRGTQVWLDSVCRWRMSLVCITTERSGIRSADDWRKAKTEVKLRRRSVPAPAAPTIPRSLGATDFPLQLIEGYNGNGRHQDCRETGEVDGTWHLDRNRQRATCAGAIRIDSTSRPCFLKIPISRAIRLTKKVKLTVDNATRILSKTLLRMAGRANAKSRSKSKLVDATKSSNTAVFPHTAYSPPRSGDPLKIQTFYATTYNVDGRHYTRIRWTGFRNKTLSGCVKTTIPADVSRGHRYSRRNRLVWSKTFSRFAPVPAMIESCFRNQRCQSRMSWRNHSVGISRPRPASLASS